MDTMYLFNFVVFTFLFTKTYVCEDVENITQSTNYYLQNYLLNNDPGYQTKLDMDVQNGNKIFYPYKSKYTPVSILYPHLLPQLKTIQTENPKIDSPLLLPISYSGESGIIEKHNNHVNQKLKGKENIVKENKISDSRYNNYVINNEFNKYPLIETDEREFGNKYNRSYDVLTKCRGIEYSTFKDRTNSMNTHSDENENQNLEARIKIFSDRTNTNAEEISRLQNLEIIPNPLQSCIPVYKGETKKNIIQDETLELRTSGKPKRPKALGIDINNVNIEINTTSEMLETDENIQNEYSTEKPYNINIYINNNFNRN